MLASVSGQLPEEVPVDPQVKVGGGGRGGEGRKGRLDLQVKPCM